MILASLISPTHDNVGMKKICDIKLTLPPRELQPNARPHWRAKAKAVSSYRSQSRDLASPWATGEPVETAVVCIGYANKTARLIDPDNIIAAMKSAIDGINDAGIITDDNQLIYLTPKRWKCAEDPHVRIVLKQPNETELAELKALFEME